jgi:hypothetical protein
MHVFGHGAHGGWLRADDEAPVLLTVTLLSHGLITSQAATEKCIRRSRLVEIECAN